MTDIQIKAMHLAESHARYDGSELLAKFDAEVRGFRLCGCEIVRKSDGYLMVALPGTAFRGDRRSISFISREFYEEFRTEAIRAFRAFTGETTAPQVSAGVRRMLGIEEAEALAMSGL